MTWALLGLSLLIALGYWCVAVRRPEKTGQPDLAITIYFIVIAVVVVALVGAYPVYYLFGFSLSSHLFRLLPIRRAIAGVVLLTGALLARGLALSEALFGPERAFYDVPLQPAGAVVDG